MIFSTTNLSGVYVIELEPRADERGFFARSWCEREFAAHGLSAEIAQINVGFSARRGTVRGMHYQVAPRAEAKTVRCTRGAIYDVAVDLRPGSSTYKGWVGLELTAQNRRTLYIPEGCAHGYQTLADDTEMCYQTSQPYTPECTRGVRYDDAAFRISWPVAVTSVSHADRSWPDYQDERVPA